MRTYVSSTTRRGTFILSDGVLDYDMTVNKIMSSWTSQPNYPVVNVTREPQGSNLLFQQSRFTLEEEEEAVADDPLFWTIPISFAGIGNDIGDSDDTRFDFILDEESVQFDAYEIFPDQPFVVNIQNSGFYRCVCVHVCVHTATYFVRTLDRSARPVNSFFFQSC